MIFKPTGTSVQVSANTSLPALDIGQCLRIHSVDIGAAIAFKDSGGSTLLTMQFRASVTGPLVEYILPPDGTVTLAGSGDMYVNPGYLL